ncbi:glucosyltransferase [Paenibacillus sp. J45TS6]|uniref:glycosyltransferase n=1 Tax=Paenibacillus sp. J45TS6 TaxID=2807196 RepID=UPI001B0620F9|nr:glycosyltransferase [Paenibacillus sp. J45TS6]GIP44128.1 glucosyltransferase [Paenibacillus sp. J45TS6]
MKLGLLRNTFLPSSETFIYEQLNQYSGWQVEVITREVINQDQFRSNQWNINSIQKNAKSKFYKLFIKLLYTLKINSTSKISKIIEYKDIDVIHAHFGVDAIYAIKACEKHNIPLFVTFHGYDITRLPKFKIYPFSYLMYYFNYKKLSEKADLFLAVSSHIRSKLIEKGFPEEKIIIHYIGIDLKKIFYREEISVNTNEIIITTVGRLTEKKGIEYLIRAFDKIFEDCENVRLRIIGDGYLKNSLLSLSKLGRSKDNIEFLGNIPHDMVIENLRRSHIFSLPSVTATDGDQEGLGMVILEASATGLPIVASRSGGIVDAVIDNETGYLVEEKNVDELYLKLKHLVENDHLRVEMGKKGRVYMEENFDISKQTKKLEILYKKYLRK